MKKSIYISILIIFYLFTGCAVKEKICIKNGKTYGRTSGLFRNHWWNLYERGVSFSEGKCYEEAIMDFRQAIMKRQDDHWKARTYGMHFINYFPHRELGIIYYRNNKYTDAIKELETSLSTADSAKTKYFLNRARRLLLEDTGKDLYPPSLQLTQPMEDSNVTITNRFKVTIYGTATDDQYVSSVRINDSPLPLDLSTERFEFEKDIRLKEGINNITVTAEDLTGKIKEKIITINSDRQGPIVTIGVSQNLGKKLKINGFVTDDTGVLYFSINGKEIHFNSPKEFYYEQEIKKDMVYIEARDIVGNVTIAAISPVKKASFRSRFPRVASLEYFPIKTVEYDSEYVSGSDSWAMDFGNFKDIYPPVFKIDGLTQFQEVFDDKILISGNVSDDSCINSLKINGEQILKKKEMKICFSKLLELVPGENIFVFDAYDSFGNKGMKKIIIYRKIQKVHQITSRMNISVSPFKNKGKLSIVGKVVFDHLISAFFNQGRFNVVARETLYELLREHKLSISDLVDKKKALEIGRILEADGIITGTIIESENSIEIIAHLIDCETSSILSSKDVFDEDKSLSSVKSLLEELVYKFKRDFPLLEGLIIETNGSEIIVDLGRKKRIKKYTKLTIFRDGTEKTHPVTGKVLGFDTIELGEAQIKDVYEEFSKAKVIKRYDKFRIMDRVITK